MSASYKFSASGGTLPRRVRDGDPHGRRLRHGGSVALGGSAALVQYCPARRTYFVRNDRVAGTRPDPSDAGTGRSYYDLAGRLRATQTQRQIDSGTATVTVYDRLDRAVATGEWRHGKSEGELRSYFENMGNRYNPAVSELVPGTVTRSFYDRMPARDTLGVELYPADMDTTGFRYSRGRLTATVSDAGTGPDGDTLRRSVADVYDKRGRVIASYVYDGGVEADSLRMLGTATERDLAGKVLRVTKYPYGLSAAGKARAVTERYAYDRLGRVDTLYAKDGAENETVLASYEYYPTGSVKTFRMGSSIALAYTYHISGVVKSAAATRTDDGATLYGETLYYEDCGSETCAQYAGNVSRMAHSLAHGNTDYGESRDVTYAYDLMNRLTNVDDADMDGFDETFAYDAQGRMTAQRRGANVTATSGGKYAYYAQSNKLEKVSAGMSDSVDAERLMNADSNFVYDADGNMTYDASKKMTVTYDWRGLPTEFRREVASASGVAGAVDSVRLLMTYDGSGSRIMKRRDRKSAGETAWTTELTTHYTGIGSEIRVSGFDGMAKVVVNLPQGLGRYGVENATTASAATPGFEWYLKNHLGSTMLVYGTGASNSVRAAYDYRAFGEQVDLTVPADKVTENFTGKEKDEETDLNYFGARYLDPMLGLWLATDSKKQFASPYLYAGNGVNPIRSTDDDGNQMNANDFALNLFMTERVKPQMEKANEVAWKGVNTTLRAEYAAGKYGLKAAAVFSPEPGSRFAANVALTGLDALEGYSENGAKGAGLALGVDFTFMGLSKKLPDNLTSRIGLTIANDLTLEAGKEMLFGDKIKTSGSEPDLMMKDSQAPSDNTRVEW